MLTEIEKAWLAGFWDGEGSITIFTHVEKNGVQKLCPTVSVVNTHLETVSYIASLLDRLGTSFSFFERKSSNVKHKNAYQLTTRNMKYIKLVLEAILPYLVTKKAQGYLTLRYVEKKLQYIEKGNKPKYDEEDFKVQKAVQGMNKTGKNSISSTTTREASSDDDIVCSYNESVS